MFDRLEKSREKSRSIKKPAAGGLQSKRLAYPHDV